MLKSVLKEFLRKFNYDIVRFPLPAIKNRMRMIRNYNIDTIIDVGANSGQYALEMFYYGFKGNIISFEPISFVFRELQEKSNNYKNWEVYNYALGDKELTTEINITNQVASSSLLNVKGGKIDAAGGIYSVKKEEIQVKTLNDIWASIIESNNPQNIYLKIDTQGYEKFVLLGADKVLEKIKGVQLEMSFKELYEGAWLHTDVTEYLTSKGFSLKAVEPSFYDEKTGELLEMDGIFYR